jgi:TPR repeat protein
MPVKQAILALSEKQFNVAFAVFSDWSSKNHPEAAFYQGLMLLEGLGVEADPARAARELRKSAELGYPPAQYRLGQMLRQGDRVPADLAEGARHLRAAANRGHENAQCLLSRVLLMGEGEPENMKESFELARAHPNNPDCQLIAAMHYYKGSDIVSKDSKQAFALMKSAADGGNLEAPFMVGLFMYRGEGTARDQATGMQWIQKAIELGDKDAIGFLAHQKGAKAAAQAISEDNRKRRAEQRRERDKFWAEVTGTLAVAMPVIVSTMQQHAAEQALALQRQAELNALRNQPVAPATTKSKASSPSTSQAAPSKIAVPAPQPGSAFNTAMAREPAAINTSGQRRGSGPSSANQEQAQPRESEPNIRWPEGLVICPRPTGGKDVLFGASVCYGPRGSAFIDRVAGDINMAEVSQACGSSAREIGWIENSRVFGCGFGINPTKESLVNHHDQGSRRGINVPNRRNFSCPAKQSDICRNPA